MDRRYSKISEVGFVFNGKTPSKSEQRDSGLPILKIKDINNDGRFNGFNSFVDRDFYHKHSAKKLQCGDTIILNAAHNASYVGSKSYYVENDLSGILPTGEWLVIRVNNKFVDHRFFHFFITSKKGLFDIKNLVKGIHLYPKDVERLEIPLPPLEIQKKIATILDKADELRHNDQKILEKYDQLAQSVFLEMFGDPVYNPKEWEVKNLEKLTTKITDGKHGDCNNKENSGYYFLSAKDLVNGELKYNDVREITKEDFREVHKRTDLKINDILLGNTGASIGKIGIIADEEKATKTTFQKSISIITAKQDTISPHYLKSFFEYNRKLFYRSSSGSAMTNLLLSQIRAFQVMVPPIELQNQFVQFVKTIEQQKQLTQQSLQKSEELFQSLLQRAFRPASRNGDVGWGE